MNKKIEKKEKEAKTITSDSTKKTSSFSVLKHAIDFLKKKKNYFDYIIMLEPTSPLRNSKDVDFCINKIKKDNIESLVSVSRVVDQHPYFLYSINKRNILRPYLKKQKKLYIRRQDVSPLYYLEGSIYISKITTLLNEKTWYHKKTQAFEVEKWKSLEIDDIDDFKLAQFYLQN